MFFIEFKSAKGKLTKLQEKKISELITNKVDVFVVNNEKLGLEILIKNNNWGVIWLDMLVYLLNIMKKQVLEK